MKIAHILAQKPSSTGSGIYLSETIRAFAEEGAEQALVAGIAPGEEYRFPDGVGFFPVVFETEGLPFPVCGRAWRRLQTARAAPAPPAGRTKTASPNPQ